MRRLAHIEKIVEICPIIGADRIETAIVLGWECVVKKGEFKAGDLVAYIEIDSIVPDHEVFSFMAPRKFRVRTIKLRKQISQGLVLPLIELNKFGLKGPVSEGMDVTDIIGIKKYDPQKQKENKYRPIKTRNPILDYLMSFVIFRSLLHKFGFQRKRNFPTFVPKTDEERIQNMPHVLKVWDGLDFYVMEKLDGMSLTCSIYNDPKLPFFFKPFQNNFWVCSRNLTLHKENNTTWWEVARKFNIKEKLLTYRGNIAIQGEIIGPGVQKNKYDLKELAFYVFNVYDIDQQKWFNLREKEFFCSNYGFKTPPLDSKITITGELTVKRLVDMASDKSKLKNMPREGIVLRSVEDDRKSFKVINPYFLLKYVE